MDVSGACARTLVDEWARAGLTDAVLAPGSRSGPLALALADDDRIRLHVHLDERCAAFFALGAARASGRPTLVVCTSGSAAAHFHPAVLEAHHSRVPLVVCTADRPAELRDTGAPQTTDQVHLYGRAVSFFADLPADGHPAARASWRPLAARLWAASVGPPPGPVHLNVAFREPLVPHPPSRGVPGDTGAEPGRRDGRPWTSSAGAAPPALSGTAAADLASRLRSAQRGLVVAGWGSPADGREVADALGWPLLADAISGLRPSGAPHSGVPHPPRVITAYEALLRAPGFAESHRPDLVVRLGAPLTSKLAMAWLDADVPQILVDPDGAWLDPGRGVSERVPALPPLEALADLDAGHRGPPRAEAWLGDWAAADAAARAALDAVLDEDDAPFEGRVARDVAAACAAARRARPGGGAALVVASSMPVRDLEAFAAAVPARVHANRGVNGIDGLVSTTLGVAAADPGGAAVGLLGDLAFLHDAGGLLGAPDRGLDVTFVVVDNDGGGIFSFLPQAALPPERFELLFGTPAGADPVAVATGYGVCARRVERAGEVGPAVAAAVAAGGVRVVVVPTGDRTANVERHRRAWSAVAAALARG